MAEVVEAGGLTWEVEEEEGVVVEGTRRWRVVSAPRRSMGSSVEG